jgi:hypothetical protein
MTNRRPDMTREKRHDNLHILPFPVPTAISSFIVPNGHETKDTVRGIRLHTESVTRASRDDERISSIRKADTWKIATSMET